MAQNCIVTKKNFRGLKAESQMNWQDCRWQKNSWQNSTYQNSPNCQEKNNQNKQAKESYNIIHIAYSVIPHKVGQKVWIIDSKYSEKKYLNFAKRRRKREEEKKRRKNICGGNI